MKHRHHQHFWGIGVMVLSLLLVLAARPVVGTAATHTRSDTSQLLQTPSPAAALTQMSPDAFENNWNIATATPIAVGVLYDLNFVCPVAWGCASGDHDYLHLTVKRNLRYLIATVDLGPGVDTALDLFWGSEERPIISNDDARPGYGFLSVIRWVAPADGTAIIRVAPRAGASVPVVMDSHGMSYRFAVALAGSDLARELEDRIAAQTSLAQEQTGRASEARPNTPPAPGPTPIPSTPPVPAAASPAPSAATAAPSNGGVAVRSPSGLTTKGTAIVRGHDTAFRIAPNPDASLIATLPVETLVTLMGQYSGLWVSVTTADSVLPGWVLGTDLRRLTPGQATPVISGTSTLPSAAPPPSSASAPRATPTAASVSSATIGVQAIAPVPPAPRPAPLPRGTVTISVTVRSGSAMSGVAPGRALRTPTPTSGVALPGIRVQLVDAFGELLAEGITNSNGHVALTREQSSGQRMNVRLPAAGLELVVDPRQPGITITIPEGDLP
jgi:hypothetical protein